MSLQDTKLITSADIKFPSTARFTGEKLCGWSVTIDIFHGVAHDVTNHVRNSLLSFLTCTPSSATWPSRLALEWTWAAMSFANRDKNTSVGPMKLQMESLVLPL